MGIRTIQQKISAGNDFDGTLPSTTKVGDKDIERFPEDAAGGLFDFSIKNPHELDSIELILSDQTSWSLSKKDSDGVEMVLWAGTNETSFVTVESDKMRLLEKQTLLLRTIGASGAMTARVAVKPIDNS